MLAIQALSVSEKGKMRMWWYLKRLWRFVSQIPATAKDAWDFSGWSRQSRGRFQDQIDFQVMLWNDVITAWSLHWRVQRYKKRMSRLRRSRHNAH